MNGQRTAAILARMKEPSTWAGLSGLLILLGVNVEAAGHLAQAGAALAGFVAVVMGEGR